ncbi:hypothetical protein [Nonomuraea jiangxiensis]|uniref:Uncharacterized protein n=1 Tax=Nonomuraea jiangxiensis TaxID=633440 RepID=A0A1G9AZE4_9ACTN|nr:hypothetical protein [Nonomuraea jiangxiensis]SDK32234.1 hypothetical protein SAMN05421869_11587 [Nonomuraea jiangxiensis]
MPVFGQVPQRRLAVSLELGGSMPSLIAATLSHGEVYDADAVALLASGKGVLPRGRGSGQRIVMSEEE